MTKPNHKKPYNYKKPLRVWTMWHYPSLDSTASCCGIGELTDLAGISEDVRSNFISMCNGENEKFNLILFTDAENYGHGKRLAAYIRKHKLGKVISSLRVKNPNTLNTVQGWFWKVDRPALEKWADKNLEFDDAE